MVTARSTQAAAMLLALCTLTSRSAQALCAVSLTPLAQRGGAIAGIVGRNLEGVYVWCRDVQEPTVVNTLDSCSVFIPRAAGIRFDEETFGGFHCCVEDICLTAQKAGMRVLVAPGPGDHTGTMWPQQQWMHDYWAAAERLARKWTGTVYSTT